LTRFSGQTGIDLINVGYLPGTGGTAEKEPRRNTFRHDQTGAPFGTISD
jgi:hypothetical protein